MRVLLKLLACALAAAPAMATTGVAFVHGTDHRTDAYNDYWKPGMVDSVRQGPPNPANFVVINCDFEQYISKVEPPGCLTTQPHGLITVRGIEDLAVITHSNGGNVMRWILSNPPGTAATPRSSIPSAGSTRWLE